MISKKMIDNSKNDNSFLQIANEIKGLITVLIYWSTTCV